MSLYFTKLIDIGQNKFHLDFKYFVFLMEIYLPASIHQQRQDYQKRIGKDEKMTSFHVVNETWQGN